MGQLITKPPSSVTIYTHDYPCPNCGEPSHRAVAPSQLKECPKCGEWAMNPEFYKDKATGVIMDNRNRRQPTPLGKCPRCLSNDTRIVEGIRNARVNSACDSCWHKWDVPYSIRG